MLKLHELKPHKGATKSRKTVGRGVGSGHGTFSGRGAKGQTARSGSSIPVGFEGGRMPLHRQLPKRRGFTSRNEKAAVFNLDDLDARFKAGDTVNPKILFNLGLVKSVEQEIKVLGSGVLKKSLNFEKITFSKEALKKVEAAGGKIS